MPYIVVGFNMNHSRFQNDFFTNASVQVKCLYICMITLSRVLYLNISKD